MFLRFSPFPTKANLQLVGEAAVTPVLRACSQKENSAFRTMPSFLCRQQTQLNDSSLLPNMSESRNSLSPHSLTGLTVSGPDAQCQSTEDIPWHRVLQQNGVSARPDIYSITASSVSFQGTNLTAAFPSCPQSHQSSVHCSGPAAAARLLVHPTLLGVPLPTARSILAVAITQQVPAGPSRSQQLPPSRREKPCRRRPLCTAGKSCTRKPELTRVITDANEWW